MGRLSGLGNICLCQGILPLSFQSTTHLTLHQGYGGLINDFLSWGVWGTISKMSFMTYLFHMQIDWYYYNLIKVYLISSSELQVLLCQSDLHS